MGMFDNIKCLYPLPVEWANAINFQTKDTHAQFMDQYEIRGDGTLWHEAYDSRWEDNDESPFGGYMNRENARWEQEKNFTGEIRFYDTVGINGWIEFSSYFLNGQLQCVHLIENKPSSS